MYSPTLRLLAPLHHRSSTLPFIIPLAMFAGHLTRAAALNDIVVDQRLRVSQTVASRTWTDA